VPNGREARKKNFGRKWREPPWRRGLLYVGNPLGKREEGLGGGQPHRERTRKREVTTKTRKRHSTLSLTDTCWTVKREE